MAKYVLVKGKAGLGNRMLSAMTGILYAMLSGRRVVIDWSDFTYSNDGQNVFPHLFKTDLADTKLPASAADSVWPPLWKGRLNKDVSQVIEETDKTAHDRLRGYRSFSFDFSKLNYAETTLVMWSYTQLIKRLRCHFHGSFAWLATKTDEDIMRWMLNDVIHLNDVIANMVQEQWAKLATQGTMIGVHIRFMDRRTSIESFYKALDKLITTVHDPTIFIATDNIDVQTKIQNRYETVVHNEKWFPVASQSMHQSHECPDRTQEAIDALIDMYMLAKCQYLVFPGSSTFSYMSSLISGAPKSNIIDVEKRDPVIQLKKRIKGWLV